MRLRSTPCRSLLAAAVLAGALSASAQPAAAETFAITPPGPFSTTCAQPSATLSDAAATRETRCVYAAIERSGTGGNLPIGQQLNTATFTQRVPVSTLTDERYATGPAATPAVIGSDLGPFLQYLRKPDGQGEQAVAEHAQYLIDQARNGRLIVLTWHAQNPFTGGGVRDRTGVNLPALLDESTAAGQAWKQQTDMVIDVLRRFADAGVPVAFRPFHEANIRSFWWGWPDPTVFRQLWDQLRGRIEAAGLHNVIWVYSANYTWGSGVKDPLSLAPSRFDVAGIDAYDDESAAYADDRIPLKVAEYQRMLTLGKPFALTEVGPLNSADGMWDPAVITRAVSANFPRTSWAMLWATYSPNARMAIVDLVGHQAWWATCTDGTCPTTRPAVAGVSTELPAICADVTRVAFADVGPSDVHGPAIGCAAGLGLASGTGTGTYSPTGTVSRAQMASFAANVVTRAGGTVPSGGPTFPDVPTDAPHAANISGLAAMGIVTGTADGQFHPAAPVNRAQVAAFVVRLHEVVAGAELPAGPSAFSDVSGPLTGDVDRAAAAGIVRGTGPGTYSPNAGLSRAQLATVLLRLSQVLQDAGHPA